MPRKSLPCRSVRPASGTVLRAVLGARDDAPRWLPSHGVVGVFSLSKGNGAAEGTRTPDPIITNDVLYQLSYCGLTRAS